MPKSLVFYSFLLLIFLCYKGNAQSVEGKWYGIGRVQMEDASDNYMAEMILKQDGKLVRGEFNYYFKDRQKSHKIEGSFDKNTRVLIIKGLPVIFYRTNDTKRSVESIMTGRFELRVSKTASVLNGLLTSNAEHQYMVPDIKYRFLRSISDPIDSSVTEEETDLLALDKTEANKPVDSPKLDSNQLAKASQKTVRKDSLKTNSSKNLVSKTTKVQPTTKPIASSNLTQTSSQISKITSPATTSTGIEAKKATATTVTASPVLVASAIAEATKKDSIPIVDTRQKNYIREIELDNDHIRVEIYDNGTIDYDSVSLHLNGKEVLAKTMLNHRSIKVNLQLDPTRAFNELSMFAENLGMIPPNTAALIVRDGQKEYQLLLQSDFSKSATLKLKVKKQDP